MKRKSLVLLSVLTSVFISVPAFAQTATDGNKLSGTHYNLNIIGVQNEKVSDISSGNRIFVPLNGSTKILLSETNTSDVTKFNDNFMVIDGNATDGSGAFQLPNPDINNTGTTTYSVFVKALGKPGGKANVTTSAYYLDPVTGETLIKSDYVLTVERSTGKSSFDNVTKELLYIYADYDSDGTTERVPLFSDELYGYFWQYDNCGLKNAQLRFYPISTIVPAP